jgi:hypothetical protein
MYTESFAGDIDEILAREAILSTLRVTLPPAQGRMDSYGFTKNQRVAMEDALLIVGKEMFRNPRGNVTIQVDQQRKIMLRCWQQAANLYQALTHNCWYAGLAGERAKPKIKRYEI